MTTNDNDFKANKILLYGYKIGMIIGLTFAVLGTLLLINGVLINESAIVQLIGWVALFSGYVMCLVSEIIYKIIYMSEKDSASYLRVDIVYSGAAIILLSFICLLIIPIVFTLKINYLYEFSIVLSVIIFEIMMMYHNNLLQKLNIKTHTKISKLSFFISIILAVILLAVFVFFRFFRFRDSYTVALGLSYMYEIEQYGVTSLEATVRFYSFLCFGLITMVLLTINCFELIGKSKFLNKA